MKKNLRIVLSIAMMVWAFTACNGGSEPAGSQTDLAQQEALEENENEEDTQMPVGDPDKKALLVISFGTSYNETRALTIEAIEQKVTATFQDYDVRRAFTSQTIINKLAERDGLVIDTVEQAIKKLIDEGFGTVVVQPTHVMNGFEYEEMMADIAPYAGSFHSIAYGKPLLSSPEDYQAVVDILTKDNKMYEGENTAIVFMGHGTEHSANETYTIIQEAFRDGGYHNYYVGTVEAEPGLEEVMAAVEASGAKKVVLLPLMIVAGDHAANDMAGDEEDSWKTAFKAAGYEVECVLKGLGEYPAIQDLFVKHIQDALPEE